MWSALPQPVTHVRSDQSGGSPSGKHVITLRNTGKDNGWCGGRDSAADDMRRAKRSIWIGSRHSTTVNTGCAASHLQNKDGRTRPK
ncbi:hypothetical protein HW555_001116 [Spodoptera exigua]|uniref:Uncharacterized protein n=1 Tax=Spodoptera exigua TaxID=7107 RepID=A0A835GR57_SPOEX|nr:hypothetical protein HW555_001116 [Spodoptera exigua]